MKVIFEFNGKQETITASPYMLQVIKEFVDAGSYHYKKKGLLKAYQNALDISYEIGKVLTYH